MSSIQRTLAITVAVLGIAGSVAAFADRQMKPIFAHMDEATCRHCTLDCLEDCAQCDPDECHKRCKKRGRCP